MAVVLPVAAGDTPGSCGPFRCVLAAATSPHMQSVGGLSLEPLVCVPPHQLIVPLSRLDPGQAHTLG